VTFDDVAAMASKISGCEIKRVVVDDEQWIADKVASGTPEVMARMTLTLFRAAREGRFAGVDPLLTELLGREPRSIADQLADSITD
jgi:NAD(P)H dehydrogenase (quinone)